MPNEKPTPEAIAAYGAATVAAFRNGAQAFRYTPARSAVRPPVELSLRQISRRGWGLALSDATVLRKFGDVPDDLSAL
jgi:hypothetical protein